MRLARLAAPIILACAALFTSCDSPTPTPTATPSPAPTPTPTATPTLAPTATPTLATPTPAPQPTPLPNIPPPEDAFREDDCPFSATPGTPLWEATCGYLTVPADYDDPTAGTFEIAVAVFPASGERTSDVPVVYLDGGPGGNTIEGVEVSYGQPIEPLNGGRDVVVFDQRGVGYSEPALECPGLRNLTRELLGQALSLAEESRQWLDALRSCRDSLAGDGVNLALFNSAANAADVDRLRAALGHEQWDLYGVSYGTRLAQEVMRGFPGGVRRAVLDSAYPLDLDLLASIPASAEQAFRLLFASCAADSACNEHYPDLEGTLIQAFDRLTASPEPGRATFSLDGEQVETLLTGERLASILFESLYQTDAIPWLPEVIAEAAKGNVEPANLLLSVGLVNNEIFTDGMHYSVRCRDEAAFTTEAALNASVAANPLFARLQDPEGTFGSDAIGACAVWDVPPSPAAANKAVQSDIPTLVLAGEFDPITPPSLGMAVAAGFANAAYVEFPAVGHGVLYEGECGESVVAAFFDGDDAPDASCASDRPAPEWLQPLDALTLTTIASPLLGVRIVQPDGWEQISPISPGGFYRDDIAGPAFVQTVIPGQTVEQLVEGILSDASGGETEDMGTVEVGGLTWRLITIEEDSRIQAMAAAQAAPGSGATGVLLAVVIGFSYQHDTLVESILRPALEVFGSCPAAGPEVAPNSVC